MENLTMAIGLMDNFALRTGLAPGGESPKRYLWTDAFAVCTFLELSRLSEQDTYLDLACALIQQVHEVLGCHRPDDSRSGWISGLSDKEGRRHPTIGGLRIGKPRNERGPDEPLDERSEWDRDGQYYHYLTKWMQALDWTSRWTGRTEYLSWAMELAQAAHRAFTYTPGPGRPKGMYWKMSIDLSRPLVPFMGQHDPVDGLVTYLQLYCNPMTDRIPYAPELKGVIEDLSTMTAGINLVSSDPLGIGGLLCNALQGGTDCSRGVYPAQGPAGNACCSFCQRLWVIHSNRTASPSGRPSFSFSGAGSVPWAAGCSQAQGGLFGPPGSFRSRVQFGKASGQPDEAIALGRGYRTFLVATLQSTGLHLAGASGHQRGYVGSKPGSRRISGAGSAGFVRQVVHKLDFHQQ